MNYDDIENPDFLKQALSSQLYQAIDESPYAIELLFEDSEVEVCDADALIESTFPADEYEQYQVRTTFQSCDQPIVLACTSGGRVYAVASLSIEDDCAELLCLAVDKELRGKKLGSILLLAINDISQALNINTMSLISSPNGTSLYNSFGFCEMAMNSYQADLPLREDIVCKKLSAYQTVQKKIKTSNLGKKRKLGEITNDMNQARKRSCTVPNVMAKNTNSTASKIRLFATETDLVIDKNVKSQLKDAHLGQDQRYKQPGI